MSPATYDQVIDLNTRVTDTVSITRGGKASTHVRHLHYPLLVDVTKHVKPGGSFTAVISVHQGYVKRLNQTRNDHPVFWSKLDDALASYDTIDFNATGTVISNSRDQHSHQLYRFSDSLGSCYARRITTRDGAVSSVASGMGCPDGASHLDWRSWPNAM